MTLEIDSKIIMFRFAIFSATGVSSFRSSLSLHTFVKPPNAIPLDIVDPPVHLYRPVTFVTEKLLHILVQTFCVQNSS